MPVLLRARRSAYKTTSRSGFLYGSGCRRTALATLKMAVLAPIPSAIVRTDASVDTGLRRRARAANARSRNIVRPPLRERAYRLLDLSYRRSAYNALPNRGSDYETNSMCRRRPD